MSSSLTDLLALSYIDELVSECLPPRSFSFLLQRLLVVSSHSCSRVSDHAVNSLLGIISPLPSSLPPPRPSIPRSTAAALISLIVSFSSEDRSSSHSPILIRGGAQLLTSLSSAFTILKPSGSHSLEEYVAYLKEQVIETRSRSSSPVTMMNQRSDLSQVLKDNGPQCTQSDEVLRSHLSRGCIGGSHCSPNSIAAAISTMLMCTSSSPAVLASFDRPGTAALETGGWNGKVFTRVITDMNPQLNWNEVFLHLDHPLFAVKDRASLILLTNILNAAFGSKPWPISMLYREWRHKIGQLSWLQQIILHADIFCLADQPHKPVVTTCLKVQPEDGNKEMANWRVAELTEVLLKLHDGQMQQQAFVVFRSGIQLCPDIVLLALFQLSNQSEGRMQLMQVIVPMLLSNHTNAVAVLNVGWNCDPVQRKVVHHIIIQAFTSFYAKQPDDQLKLARILDIAHELKPNGLTELFKSGPLSFTIDLACLASKRDFLKLEKWLEDQQAVHGEPFTMAVMGHIRRRLPMGGPGQSAFPSSMSQEVFTNLHSFVSKYSQGSSATRLEFNNLVTQLHRMQMRNDPSRSGSSSSASNRLPSMPNFMGRQPSTTPSQQNVFGTSVGRDDLTKGNVSAFGGNPLSMSPSNQMMRSTQPLGPPSGGRTPVVGGTVGGGWGMAPGASTMRSTPVGNGGGSMSSIEYRPVMNPGQQALSDIGSRGSSSMEELTQTHFSEQIQTEANSYFEKIYAPGGGMTVTDLLTKLKTFKMGTNKREHQVLQCVVKNLFEEYRFFKEYPERELKITAEVYGGIIREGIISNLHFATAVRKMIESLQSEVNSMLWKFGIEALTACRTKLSNYPKVCVMIAQHSNFSKFPDSLRAYVSAGVNGQLPLHTGRESPAGWNPSLPSPLPSSLHRGMVPSSSSSLTSSSIIGANRGAANQLTYNVTNVETLVAATEASGLGITPPREEVVDKVSFLFNNLSLSNLNTKRDEIRMTIGEEGEPFLRWLAQYIVMKRVSIEQNFQPLYNQFVTAIDNVLLDRFIKEETFRNIKILLRSDKRQAASNYNERQLLKNLGLWLGSMTIAKNKPIIVQDLDLRSLLLEAYYKGQQELLYVIPFIAKILLSCAKTQLFPPTCAWMRSLLKILAELHNEPDLKINLKFEIEVLCKELQVDLGSLPVEGVLKDTDKLLKVPQQLSDLKLLTQPATGGAGCSPIPPQMRQDGMATPPVPTTTDTNRSTPVSVEADSTGVSSIVGTSSTTEAIPPSTAAFHYSDINVVTYEGIVPHLKISASLPLFQLHPQLKQMVRVAVTHAIKELIGPVTERALKVALTVTESVVKKDFALDGDEQQMRRAGHSMMRAMTAGMAAITCRDPLSTSMIGYLTQAFTNSSMNRAGGNSAELQKMMDEAAVQITQDNVELTTNFIVKTACEKAASELDKRLEAEVEARRTARRDGRQFGDISIVNQQKLMPDKLRVKPGAVTEKEMAVYEEFSSRICGFKSGAEESVELLSRPLERASDADVDSLVNGLNFVIKDIEVALNACKTNPELRSNLAWEACSQIRSACYHLAHNARDSNILHRLVGIALEQLLYAYTNTYVSGGSATDLEWMRRLRELFIRVCQILGAQITLPDLARRMTSLIVSSRMEHRFNVYAIEVLVKHRLLQASVYDAHLAHIVDSGSLEAAVFATKLCKLIGGVDGMKNATVKDVFPKTIDAIAKAMSMLAPSSNDVMGGVTPHSAPSAMPSPAISSNVAASEGLTIVGEGREENPEMCAKVELILRDWIALCYTPMAQKEPQQALATMIHLMHEQGVLATDDLITRFFRLCTELCIDVGYRLLKNDPLAQTTVVRQRCYYTLDAFVKLTCLMVKHSDGSQHQTKINLLKKVLNIVTSVLHNDHETKLRRGEFQSMPYHRMIIIMFNELTAPDASLEPIAWPILEAFGQAFFILQPRRCPGFAFSWLDIIGHRNVIARLLGESVEPVRTAAMYTQLLICHLKFLAPFLRNLELPKSISQLYKGTLRVLLVILHDFPELLCEYHYVICDAIPPNCVQLRNLVLSAYPRNMRLPDPFALSFKQVDAISEMANEPKMCLNVNAIMTSELRSHLDHYLNTRSSVDFLSQLPSFLQVSQQAGSKYNTTVVNAVVIYVGMRAMENIDQRGLRVSMTTIAHSAYMDIFQNLAVQLCTEGRYLVFNAIANQLRYPNVHTHYFSCVFLFLFLHADSPAMKEQITRILFERLVALRPHPWGLLITFIELINNPQYNFWNNDFTRCAPEILRLFQNVANTCVLKANPSARTEECRE